MFDGHGGADNTADVSSRRKLLRKIDTVVQDHGMCVQYVGPGEGEPAFAYTVGLFLHEHPEFLIEGLPIDLAHQLLNDMAFSVLRSRMRFSDGDHVEHLVSNNAIALVEVADPKEFLSSTYAIRKRRSSSANISALQVVLPDRDGLFPWDLKATLTRPPHGVYRSSGHCLALPSAEERRLDGW